ncbi:MAG TPA: hypothetical protein VLK36_04535 [Gaiellaceae bacterium]|nr:hypothetical protein [Gaiellaceae bacterium]
MPAWAWVLIAVGLAIVVLAIVAGRISARRRRTGLRDRFGPEYERTVDSADSRRKAEAELVAREERRSELEIRPLTAAARSRYLRSCPAPSQARTA